MCTDELGAKVVALVNTRVDRETATLKRKLALRTKQRDRWEGEARSLKSDLREAHKRISALERELSGKDVPPEHTRNPLYP